MRQTTDSLMIGFDKKGQVETMGLVIIVILVIMIGLFFLIFSLKGDQGVTEDVFLSTKVKTP